MTCFPVESDGGDTVPVLGLKLKRGSGILLLPSENPELPYKKSGYPDGDTMCRGHMAREWLQD